MSFNNVTNSIYRLEYPQHTILVPNVTIVTRDNSDNTNYLYLGILESNPNNIVLQDVLLEDVNDPELLTIIDPKIERIRVVLNHLHTDDLNNDNQLPGVVVTNNKLFDPDEDGKIVLPDPAHIAELREKTRITNMKNNINLDSINRDNGNKDHNAGDIHKLLGNIHTFIKKLDPDKLKSIHENLEATLTVYKITKEPTLLQYIVIGYLQEMIKTNGESK